MATYIVGDIQGCFPALEKLLSKVNFNPSRDKLWAVGDLIGRGPHSLETLDYLYNLGNAFDTVLGNHDLHFLAISQGIRSAKASDKFDALLASSKCQQFVEWLRHKPLAVKLDADTLLSHAGLYPKWGFKQAIKRSLEVENMLQADNWFELLANMYSNEPRKWSKSLEGYQRATFVINAYTRMRYIEDKALLNLTAKGTPQSALPELSPWFKIKNKKLKKRQKIIFGHWAALQGKTASKQYIGLDTGYIWGNCLTMLELESMEYYSVRFKDKKLVADTMT